VNRRLDRTEVEMGLEPSAGTTTEGTESPPELLAAGSAPPADLRTLMKVAWPLIVSGSLTTIQITVDRIFLSHLNADVASASTASMSILWLPFSILFFTAGYVATFVSQYSGAGRPHRVGAAVWHALYFSIAGGVLFLGMHPFADDIFAAVGHSPHLQVLEADFFRCLCWYGLPASIIAALNGFFSARGQSWTVILLSAITLAVTIGLDYVLIFGHLGFPALGIVGAGWATVAGAATAAIVGFVLFLRPRYRELYSSHTGWRFDPNLFWRLLRYGIPNAVQWMLDISAFNAFIVLAGWFGDAELAATGLGITINHLAFIPMFGLAQAVAILVGTNLGVNNPDGAERVSYLGMRVAAVYMVLIGLLYVLFPSVFLFPFQGDNDAALWNPIAERTRVVLWFVAAFAFFDAVNIVFNFALRGAGDTVFVSLVSLLLAWPVMVIPSYLAYRLGWEFYWTWVFVTVYVMAQATSFYLRFRGGKWKSMRVIEGAVIE
jgi:MATE family multidrug resistance protein